MSIGNFYFSLFADFILLRLILSDMLIYTKIKEEADAINRIKEFRISLGLKQSELANLIGVRQNTLSTWETGRYEPDLDALAKMSELFGRSIDDIIGHRPVNSPASSGGTWIPVLGDVAAGIPIEAVESDTLSEEDAQLLRRIHALSPAARGKLLGYLDALSE